MFEPAQIFVPLDHSRPSGAALALARSLSVKLQSAPRLQIAHALERLPRHLHAVLFPYAAMGEDSVEFERELVISAREALTTRFDLSDIERDATRCEVGAIKEQLPQMLLSSPCEIVIMGAFGEGGALPESLGSTAARMLRTSCCPVLLAREASGRRAEIKRLLCAIDLTPQSLHVLRLALGLAIGLEADFHALFVLPDPLTQDPHGLLAQHLNYSPEALLMRSTSKIEALFERTYRALQVPYPQRQRAEQLWRQRHTVAGPVARSIVERADRLDADLVVLGARDLNSSSATQLGRTCWDVTRQALTHTLVVPPLHELGRLDPKS